ncbi:MAG TPA: urease accessory protein UreD [Polyangia bacterium]
MHSPPALVDFSSWKASLALTFLAREGGTQLLRRGHQGPLVVQRPFFPEGRDVCHTYILHPPGGIVPGDYLNLDIAIEAGAHALITAPAATKVYRSDGRISRQVQTLRASASSAVEWLPQETILFQGARAHLSTRIELSGSATFVGWDILCLGRPACGERFGSGACRQHFELWRDGRPLVLERTGYEGDIQDAAWGLQGAPVTGTLLASGPALTDETKRALQHELRGLRVRNSGLLSASEVSGVLVLRYLGNAVEQARILFEKAWHILRPVILGRPACLPRIWST